MQKSDNPPQKGCVDILVIPIIASVVAGIIAGILLLFMQYRSGLFEKADETRPTPIGLMLPTIAPSTQAAVAKTTVPPIQTLIPTSAPTKILPTTTVQPSTSPPTELIQPLPSAYIVLYKDNTFRGSSLKIDLDDCGKININQDSVLHDSTSSFMLVAPSNVEVVLVQHHTYDGDYPGNTGMWRGNNGNLQVNINELKAQGVHDNVSSIQWRIDGKLLSDRTCQVD